MRIRGIWADLTPYLKLVLFIMLLLMSGFASTALAGFLIRFVYGINILDQEALANIQDPAVLGSLKLLQIFTAFGTFIFSSLLAAFLFSNSPLSYLSLNKKPMLKVVWAMLVVVLVSTPLINWMMVWNQHLKLPDFMHPIEVWMKSMEAKAANLTDAFMKMSTLSQLLLNLFMIGLIPAIGEELVFRGIIQKLFQKLIKNSFVAVLFTSILFSAMHLQFYGFVPRMALGILLGYLLQWSGSLWLPMLFHFLINGSQVLMAYFYPSINMDQVGTAPGEIWQLVVSCLLLMALCYYIYYNSKQKLLPEGSRFMK